MTIRGRDFPHRRTYSPISNYGGSGRTLLRWSWSAGSGNLGVNQQLFVLVSTTIQGGVVFGALSNTVSMSANGAGFSQRCSGSSTTDAFDLDGDSSTSDTLCTATGTLTVAPIASVAALRESSVIFATILGALFLNEKFGWSRVAAAAAMVGGAVALRLG